MIMKALGTSETSFRIFEATLRNISDDSHLQTWTLDERIVVMVTRSNTEQCSVFECVHVLKLCVKGVACVLTDRGHTELALFQRRSATAVDVVRDAQSSVLCDECSQMFFLFS